MSKKGYRDGCCRLLPALLLTLSAAVAGCATGGGNGDGGGRGGIADAAGGPACDNALDRMNGWAQGLVRPLSEADRGEMQRLALATEAACAGPAAASDGISRADAALAAAYAMQRRFPAALETLQDAADQDSPEALMVLSNLVGQGMGTAKNQSRSAQLLNRAAEVGGPTFMIRAAQEFLAGISVERDIERAGQLYRQAIELGSADAMMAYATDYLGLFRARTEPAQAEQALRLVTRAATERQSGDAMAMLAGFYLSERGRNLDLAEQWADRALAAGSQRAYRAKGLVAFTRFRQAVGDRQLDDYSQVPQGVEAADWFRRGAEAGDPQSAAYLGEMYMVGIGVGQDRAAAERWLREARAGGSQQGARLLRELRQPRLPEQSDDAKTE